MNETMRGIVVRTLGCALAFGLVALAASVPAHAQMRPRPAAGPAIGQLAYPQVYASLAPARPGSGLASPLLPAIQPAPAPAAPAAEEARPSYFTFGLRGGVFGIADEDGDEVYGAMLQFGADVKLHIWKLPLALQIGYDLARGEGSTDDYGGVDGVDAEGRLVFWNLRLSLIVEPPPGLFGSGPDGFYVTPYVGGGIGHHVIEIDLEGDTALGPFDETVTEERVGYHALAGIDFVIAGLFSVGLELMWSTVQVSDPLDEDETLDYGGLSASLTLRFHL